MNTLTYIILTTTAISLLSLIGVFILSLNQSLFNKFLTCLVGLSTGTLLGGAFFHLLPEAAENMQLDNVFLITVLSFIIFFLIEKLLHWRHCHDEHCEEHTFGHMNLLGDAVHNFIDGMIIAGTFLVSVPLGVASTVALMFHEIPQEISDFGVLVYSGVERKKAVALNFLVALTSVLGGIVGYSLAAYTDILLGFLLPFAAGGFLYVSTSDLLPELRKDDNLSRSIISTALFLGGVTLMYLLKNFE